MILEREKKQNKPDTRSNHGPGLSAMEACAHLVGERARSLLHCISCYSRSMEEGRTEVLANTKKENTNELVDAWNARKVSTEVIRGEAVSAVLLQQELQMLNAPIRQQRTNASRSIPAPKVPKTEMRMRMSTTTTTTAATTRRVRLTKTYGMLSASWVKGNQVEYQVAWEGKERVGSALESVPETL